MNKLALSLALLTLAACIPADPIVSDYNGSSVKIVTSAFADVADVKAETQKEADRICAKNNRRAEYASTMTNSQTYDEEHLYLCL